MKYLTSRILSNDVWHAPKIILLIFIIFLERTFVNFSSCIDSDRKWTIIVRTSFMYVNHCNSCLLIISASISHSKPLANADRTLSLSRSPHFAPLYCSTSAKTPSSFSSTPSDSSICAWCVQEPPTVTPAELVSNRAYALQSYTDGQRMSCRYRQ